MPGIEVSLGKIASLVKDAWQRAQTWLSHQQSSTPRTQALDEHDNSQRGKASLHGCPQWTHLGQHPPREIDGDGWTFVLWDGRAGPRDQP